MTANVQAQNLDGEQIYEFNMGTVERGNLSEPQVFKLVNTGSVLMSDVIVKPFISPFQNGEVTDTVGSTLLSLDNENYLDELSLTLGPSQSTKIYLKWQPRWLAIPKTCQWSLVFIEMPKEEGDSCQVGTESIITYNWISGNLSDWITETPSCEVSYDSGIYRLYSYAAEDIYNTIAYHDSTKQYGKWRLRGRFDSDLGTTDENAIIEFGIMDIGNKKIYLRITNKNLSLYYWNGSSASSILSTQSITPSNTYHIYEVEKNLYSNQWTVKMDNTTISTGSFVSPISSSRISIKMTSNLGSQAFWNDYVELL